VKRDYTYVVLGLGGIGSAAAYRLARRVGSEVCGLEQFHFGHGRGASQDHSRIIRRSYHTPGYVELANSAYEAWNSLEDDCDRKLIVRTGGLDLWPSAATLSRKDYTSSMQAADVAFEVLDAAETMRRWPQFRLEDDTVCVYQADGGIAPAAQCNAAHISMARSYGATLLENHPVTSVRAANGEIDVFTQGRSLRCSKLIIAADAWTNTVLGWLGHRLPLTVTQEQVTYFACASIDEFRPQRFPVWIWMGEPSFYGLPAYGEPGPKVAQDVGGREVTATTRTFDTDSDTLARVVGFLEAHLPGAMGPVISTKTCLYTMPPDRDFVIDALPGCEDVLVALGAAHAFKFAALFGRILEELAIDGVTAFDIGPFAIDRAALTAPNPTKSFAI
jgi:sarcosine oxidase